MVAVPLLPGLGAEVVEVAREVVVVDVTRPVLVGTDEVLDVVLLEVLVDVAVEVGPAPGRHCE